MKNQTAVEWFVKQLQSNSDIRWRGTNINELAEQALAMEKEQIIDAYRVGKVEATFPREKLTTGEQYYKETYNK
jgi:hypothetical protein